ncbi:MAG: DUF2442 domain-containing protein [Clostridia bacterium]|nr:DUF2442 domain-containing protein [Clostridia bacterium]
MIPPRIKSVKAFENYDIEIEYYDGEKKLYNMQKQLIHPYYEKLKNIAYFLLLKSADTTIEWPDGEDIDPNELYENSKSI